MADDLTSTQKGAVTEQAVAAALMLGSKGRLSPFVPLADDHGIDLIIADKETGALLPLQVKSWTKEPSKTGIIQFDLQRKTFRQKAETLLVGVLFDVETASIRQSWVMTMNDVEEVASVYKEKYAIGPSVRPNTRDRYRPFRHETVKSLVHAIQEKIDTLTKI